MGGKTAAETSIKVSVIIPVYDAEKYLRRCVESVLTQTLTDFELICVDDGSSDGSLAILREYEAADARMKVLAREHVGGGAARNAALEVAQGEYLAFLDADDFFEPTMLERMVSAADEQQSDIALCRSWFLDDVTGDVDKLDWAVAFLEPDTVYSADDLWEYLFRYSNGWPWDKVFRRSFIEEHELRFQELRSTNDALFVFVALALVKRFILVDEYLVTHRINNKLSIENTREQSWNNSFLAMRAIKERLCKEGIYDKAEQSFLNWVLDFSCWNLKTLSGQAQEDYLDTILEEILPQLIDKDRSYFYDAGEHDAIQHFHKGRADLAACQVDHCRELEWFKGQLRKRDEALAQAQLEGAQLRATVEACQARISELESSTSFRVGRAITAVPRALKTALRRIRS